MAAGMRRGESPGQVSRGSWAEGGSEACSLVLWPLGTEVCTPHSCVEILNPNAMGGNQGEVRS